MIKALCISRSYIENNYIRWFRLVATLSPLEQAAVLPYVSAVRRCVYQMVSCMQVSTSSCVTRSALAALSKAYSSKNATIPTKTLCDWLRLSNAEHTAKLCSAYGKLSP